MQTNILEAEVFTAARVRTPGRLAQRDDIRSWVTAATLAAVAGLLLVRRIHLALHPQLYAEDGVIFWVQDYANGWRAWFTPYAGYLHLAPRLLAWLAGPFGPRWAPLLYFWGAMATHLAVAWGLLSPRVQLRWKPALALSTVLVVHTTEVFANVTNVQWVLALGFVALATARDAATRGERFFDFSAAGLLGLTGPFSLFFAPLFCWRAWRRRSRHSRALAGIVVTCALTQAMVLLTTHVPIHGASPDLGHTMKMMNHRVWVEFVSGFNRIDRVEGLWLWVAGFLVSGCFLGRGWRERGPSEGVALIAGAWLALVLAVGIKFHRESSVLDGACADRYFYIPHVLTLWWLIQEAARSRSGWRWGVLGAAVVSVASGYGCFQDERLPECPWAEVVEAVREGKSFSVSVNPVGCVLTVDATQVRGRK